MQNKDIEAYFLALFHFLFQDGLVTSEFFQSQTLLLFLIKITQTTESIMF